MLAEAPSEIFQDVTARHDKEIALQCDRYGSHPNEARLTRQFVMSN